MSDRVSRRDSPKYEVKFGAETPVGWQILPNSICKIVGGRRKRRRKTEDPHYPRLS
jgi:hypothetical protein